MILHQPEVTRADGRVRVSARIESRHPKLAGLDRLWFEVDEASGLGVIDGADPFLVAAIPIDVRCETLEEAPSEQRGSGVACGFSGGVDSLYTVWSHTQNREPIPEYRLGHALLINGFDLDLDLEETGRLAALREPGRRTGVGSEQPQQLSHRRCRPGRRDPLFRHGADRVRARAQPVVDRTGTYRTCRKRSFSLPCPEQLSRAEHIRYLVEQVGWSGGRTAQRSCCGPLLGQIRLEPTRGHIGRPYCVAQTSLDALALLAPPPGQDGPEAGSNSLRWWRRQESNACRQRAWGRTGANQRKLHSGAR